MMKIKENVLRLVAVCVLLGSCVTLPVHAQQAGGPQTVQTDTGKVASPTAPPDTSTASLQADAGTVLDGTLSTPAPEEESFYKSLKRKFIEGDAGFMSLVAMALVLGLAICIERIIYLTICEINAKHFMKDLSDKIVAGNIEDARRQCEETRGPVAAMCLHGVNRLNESIENIERTVMAYGEVQAANLEKGCSWITLFVAMAPSLGFLGTVIGMVMAFEQIQLSGDLNATVVASGMKVALITTIFGIIVALILQLFYNYILSKIEHLTCQMEESVITFLDAVMAFKSKQQ